MSEAILGKDPRSDSNATGNANNPATGAPGTPGGYKDLAARDLGNGTAALLVISVSAANSSVTASTSSTQLLAANSARVAATIVNEDAGKNLYVGLNGAAAVVGTNAVAPSAAFNVSPKDIAGQVNGIWDAGASGSASITAFNA